MIQNGSKEYISANVQVLQELASKFKAYQVAEIDIYRIAYFLTQFDNIDQIHIVVTLLKQIEVLDNRKITYLLKKGYNQLDSKLTDNPVISSLGGIQDSSAMVCYGLLKELYADESELLARVVDINSFGNILEKETPTSIILFDDNITSGTQLEQFFKELIEGSEDAELIKQPLTKEQFEKLKTIPIRICYAIQLSQKSNEKIEHIIAQ